MRRNMALTENPADQRRFRDHPTFPKSGVGELRLGVIALGRSIGGRAPPRQATVDPSFRAGHVAGGVGRKEQQIAEQNRQIRAISCVVP